MSGKTENWTNNQITDPAEQFNLGRCYYHGDGVPQDYQQAVYWYRRAAEQGHCEAQYNLGACYENGDGVPQDYQQAVYWYRKAAEQGDTDAKQKLRTCRVHAISYTKGLENMWKINWKLVSVLVIIGGLVSVFVYSNTKSAIIFVVALIITAYMDDESNIKAERRKELIKKYYSIYGDFIGKRDIVEELAKEIRRETGRKLSVDLVRGESALVINEITRTGEKQ